MNKRLIDGDKLLEWLDQKANALPFGARYSDLQKAFDEVKSGRFDIPSDQGEAARLREALKELRRMEFAEIGHSTWITEFIDHALSSHKEDADKCDHEIVPYNDKWECAFCGKESGGGEADE